MENGFSWEGTFYSTEMSPNRDDGLRKGPWTHEEDMQLVSYVSCFGEGRWDALAKASGLKRSGKSCRLRWVNYLHPDLKKEKISPEEERLIIDLHSQLGNRWSRIAENLPGRTDNEIKNYFRTHIRRKDKSKQDALDTSTEKNTLEKSTDKIGVCVLEVEAPSGIKPGSSKLKNQKEEHESSKGKGKLTLLAEYTTECREGTECLQFHGMCIHNIFVGPITTPLSYDFGNPQHSDFQQDKSVGECGDAECPSVSYDSFDDETFVDYSDRLWDINKDVRDFVPKHKDW